MDVNEFQNQGANYKNYPQEIGPYYTILAAQSELGKLAEKIKTYMLDQPDGATSQDKQKIIISIGDVIFYLSQMAFDLGYNMNDVLAMELRKQELLLKQRVEKNKASSAKK